MKIQRYYSQGFGESDDGDICWAEDVAYLEASHARLYDALKAAIALYGKFGAIVNDPHAPGEWISQARAAIAKAEGGNP